MDTAELANLDSYNIPQWLKDELPAIPVPELVYYDEASGLFVVTVDGEHNAFESMDEAYQFANENSIDFVFGETIPPGFSSIHSQRMLTSPDGFVYLSHSATDKLGYLEAIYARWLETVEIYDHNPSDFFNSWNFVHDHPVLWVKDPEKNARHRFKDFIWEASPHVISPLPYKNGKGNVVWNIECSERYVDDSSGNTGYAHNYKLDVDEPTIEEAFIQLARNMRDHYNLDGSVHRI